MIKVYITGIAGLLGNTLAHELKNKYVISGADRNELDVYGCEYDVFDLLDFDKLENRLKERNPDVIIHAAALVNVDGCEVNKTLARRMNVELTDFLVDYAGRNSIKLIYISTDAVFDGDRKDYLYTENDITNPLNEYGKTKLEGEKSVLCLTDGLVLRTNIYGFNIRNKFSFGEWIVSSLEDGQTLNMFTDVQFSPLLVNELAKIINECIEKNISGLYHACATGSISKYEFGVYLKNEFGIQSGAIRKSTSEQAMLKAKRSTNMGMSNEKLRKKLHIEISTPIEGIDAFKKLYNHQRGTNYGN